MNKFYSLKHTKLKISFLVFSTYLFWVGFLFSQGLVIQSAIEKNLILNQFFIFVGLLAVIKILSSVCDIVLKFVIEHAQNKALLSNWRQFFPRKLYKDNEQKYNLIYLKYFDYLPNLFKTDCYITVNKFTLISIYALLIFSVVITKFYIGFAAILLSSTFGVLNKVFFVKIIEVDEETKNTKLELTHWIKEYFLSYKEIYFNSHQEIEPAINKAYENLYATKAKELNKAITKKIILRLISDIPLALNVGFVSLVLYLGSLNIAEIFVWLGIYPLMTKAIDAFFECRSNILKKNTLKNVIEDIDSAFYAPKEAVISQQDNILKSVKIKMLDESINFLSLKPGIYHIKGTQGAGKTTLLNTILGFERQCEIDNANQLRNFLSGISHKNIRIIDQNAIVFNGLNFKEQILGYEFEKTADCKSLMFFKFKYMFSQNMCKQLQEKYFYLEEKINSDNVIFTKEDRLLLSLMRMLASWDTEVKIIIVDDSKLFMNNDLRSMFFKCIKELSIFAAIFISINEIYYSGNKDSNLIRSA